MNRENIRIVSLAEQRSRQGFFTLSLRYPYSEDDPIVSPVCRIDEKVLDIERYFSDKFSSGFQFDALQLSNSNGILRINPKLLSITSAKTKLLQGDDFICSARSTDNQLIVVPGILNGQGSEGMMWGYDKSHKKIHLRMKLFPREDSFSPKNNNQILSGERLLSLQRC